jgi:hypothetical protein
LYLGKEGQVEKPVSLRMYSLHELVAIFERSGLEFKAAWGDLDFEPLTYDHMRQSLLGEKTTKEKKWNQTSAT